MIKTLLVCMYISTSLFASDCYESSIMKPSPFMGNNDEVFKLADGSLWKVANSYSYMYAYYPQVVICPSSGKLMVNGKNLTVQQLSGNKSKQRQASKGDDSGVIESNIDGTFNGWDGETIFKLRNGQIWQQSSYAYTYHYAYSPQVTIYKSGGSYQMRVDDVDSSISVTRLK